MHLTIINISTSHNISCFLSFHIIFTKYFCLVRTSKGVLLVIQVYVQLPPREYKKNCTGFNPRTRPKWSTWGQNAKKDPTFKPRCQKRFQLYAKMVNNILTLGQNFQEYFKVKPKCSCQNMIWLVLKFCGSRSNT